MAGNEIKFSADAREVNQAQDKIVQGEGKVDAALDKTAKKSRETAAQRKRDERDLEYVLRRAETAEEKKNRRLEAAKQLYGQSADQAEKYKRAVNAINQEYERTKDGTTKVSQSLRGLGTSGAETSQSLIAGLKGVLATALSAAAAINQMRKEYENLKERQGEAAETQLQIASAEREALDNLGIQTPEDAERLRGRVDAVAEKTGARRSDLYGVFSAALSSKGANLTEDDAADAVEAAALISPDDADGMEQSAIAILNEKKRHPDAKAGQIAGFHLAVKQVSPIVENAAFAKNIAPTIPQLEAFGDDEREAAALLATLGQGMGDVRGEQTATASLQIAKQLKVLLPNLKSTAERIRAVQQNADLQNRLLGALGPAAKEAAEGGEKGELSAEAKAFIPIVELLSGPETRMGTLFTQTLDQIPSLEQGGARFEARNKVINSSPFQRLSQTKRTLQSGVESLQASDESGAMTSISREGLQDVLQAAGVPAIEQTMEGIGFELDGGLNENQPLEHVADRIRARQKDLTRTRYYAAGPAQPMPFGPSEKDKEIAEKLGKVAGLLEKMLAEQAQQHREDQQSMQQQTQVILENSHQPPPRTRSPADSLSGSKGNSL